MTDGLIALFTNLSFGVAALAAGLWLSLGVRFYVTTTGLRRHVLCGVASVLVLNLLPRILAQVETYTVDAFEPLDFVRLFANLCILGFGGFILFRARELSSEEPL